MTEKGFLVLSEEETDWSYGFKPEERPMDVCLKHGFIPVDKPAGPTSHDVVAWIKQLFGVKKAGHSGTLDPGVTGVLPVALENATKALQLLLRGSKEYVALARFHAPVSEGDLSSVLEKFTGEIYQRPPQKASVKRATRVRRIHSIEVLERVGNLALLAVKCEAGTYVRKLIHDVGEVLGCGASMVELRRTAVEFITDRETVRLHELFYAYQRWKEENSEDLLRKYVWPVERILRGMKVVYVKDSAVDSMAHGAQVAIPAIVKLGEDITKGERVAILSLKGELVAIGTALIDAEKIERMTKGLAFKLERVVMEPNVYPRMWRSKGEKA